MSRQQAERNTIVVHHCHCQKTSFPPPTVSIPAIVPPPKIHGRNDVAIPVAVVGNAVFLIVIVVVVFGMDRIGLDRIGLDWIGLDWTGLDWTGVDWTGLEWTGLDWTGLDWSGVEWTGLDWTGVDSCRILAPYPGYLIGIFPHPQNDKIPSTMEPCRTIATFCGERPCWLSSSSPPQ